MELNTATEPAAPEAPPDFTIEVSTANLSNGQPVVVLLCAGQGLPLQLHDAMDLGNALIAAVAASKIVEPVAEPSLIHVP